MKKIIVTIVIILLGSFSLISVGNALLFANARLKGFSFTIADFVAPAQVHLDTNMITTNKDQVFFSWSTVHDFKNTSEPVYYRFNINAKEYKVDTNDFILDVSPYEEAVYIYKVKACDVLNNCSEWSESGQLIIDRTAPDFEVSLDETIFEETLSYQESTQGSVTKENDIYQISSSQSETFWQDNYLQYTFDKHQQSSSVYFKYKIFSNEVLSGFDQAKLIVTLNDEIILIDNQTSESWKEVLLDTSFFDDDTSNLRFYSGNQGDTQLPSWVEITDITFNVISSSQLEQYKVSSSEEVTEERIMLENGHRVQFLVTDLAGNVESKEFQLSDLNPVPYDKTKMTQRINELGIIIK
jgi:hypothetical protein